MSIKPCDQDVFDNGQSVCLVDIPKETAENICRSLSAATGCKIDWHYIGGRVHIKALAAPVVERQEPVAFEACGTLFKTWMGARNYAGSLPIKPLYAEQTAPVAVMHPFADKVIRKLQRFQECADDGQGADIGRHWFDLLTQLGLLNRVQRSPALWDITQQGEDCLDKIKELNQ